MILLIKSAIHGSEERFIAGETLSLSLYLFPTIRPRASPTFYLLRSMGAERRVN